MVHRRGLGVGLAMDEKPHLLELLVYLAPLLWTHVPNHLCGNKGEQARALDQNQRGYGMVSRVAPRLQRGNVEVENLT